MSAFSADWLKLRESADSRARNGDVANAVSAWFALRETLSVTDIGSGTGSNLRAIAPLLPARQSWRLVDADSALLNAAERELESWADAARRADDGALILTKGASEITVRLHEADLTAVPLESLFEGAGLVTASAFFDLTSHAFIRTFARAVAQSRAAFYSALTYNGLQRWAPHRPADNQIAAAFNRHQMTDKGFGPAAGPEAPSLIADQFRLEGYNVLEGESPWVLGQNDRMLIEELQRGHALAVLELGALDDKTVTTWVKTIRAAAEIGHTDTFAVPA